MSPRQFVEQLQQGAPAPGYLFAGNELFSRDHCRRALIKAVLGAEPPDDALIQIDLAEQPLSKVVDEARMLSLFTTARLVIGYSADASLPRGPGAPGPGFQELAAYMKDPTPGVVVLIESTRFDWSERDDKAKLERLEKLFACLPRTVRFERLNASQALAACTKLSQRLSLRIDRERLAELVEMLGADMSRLANELDKLALFTGGERPVTHEDLEKLIPEARQSGMFAFSDALCGRDRQRALNVVDTLAESGAYWPMQINLLAGLFRQALAVKEQRVRSPQQTMQVLQGQGQRVWPARARQVFELAQRFSLAELERALLLLFGADRDLRRERPDDRLIIEQLVMGLTG